MRVSRPADTGRADRFAAGPDSMLPHGDQHLLPDRIARRWPCADAMALPALFGPACATAMLAGAGACLALPALPAWPWLLVVACTGVMASRERWARLAGHCSASRSRGLHAAHALRQQFPWHGRQGACAGWAHRRLPLHDRAAPA